MTIQSIKAFVIVLFLFFIHGCGSDEAPAPNNAPTVSAELIDLTLIEGFSTNQVSLSSIFKDEDNDALSYTAKSTDESVVTVAVSGTNLTITEVSVGAANITVTASDDDGGSVSDTFSITVDNSPNVAPTVANAIADVTVDEGFGTETVDLTNVFIDSNSDVLTYTAQSSATAVVTVSINGTTLTLTEVGIGSADVTVTVNDGNEGTVSDTFSVTVNNIANAVPTVANAIPDVTLDQGFGTETVDLTNVFIDGNSDVLTFTALSSATGVVTVSINGATLTLTEVGVGSADVTVTANDGNDGTVEDMFEVGVMDASTCSIDNSTQTDLNECTFTAADAGLTGNYTESILNDLRTISTNGVPDHDFGSPKDKIAAIDVTWTMDATPADAGKITYVLGQERIDFQFGVALNGVKLDPAANFPYENTSSGEQNYDWVLEAVNNTATTTLDCNQAHLQAQGAYHYHGDFVNYASKLGVDGSKMVQVGWAADGFPIYYKYAHTTASDANSAVKEFKASYQVKIGDRPGDGVSAPCGAYNGKYEQDHEYVASISELDECNGRTGVTPEFPNGTYYYLITDTYPLIPRCFKGTPNNSFRVGGGG